MEFCQGILTLFGRQHGVLRSVFFFKGEDEVMGVLLGKECSGYSIEHGLLTC